ncbi:MAG: response regulator transcription factor [Pseudomonadota bacterium]
MARIIVVEDEELIATMLRINLRGAGHEVQVFPCAEDMLEHLEHEIPDIVLLDIMLPGMNGDEALRKLRAMGHDLPVMMLTARKDAGLKVSALDGGADDYVTKPFDMAELQARIRALLRRNN